ncbi:hypothetical protein [Nonomuraea sp. NPDC003804]|uniref:hypothetical protein n=1 Tax=Nonomuraea sp. NPDC003804 TaxID=3154547 RepID=UPI0033B94CD5
MLCSSVVVGDEEGATAGTAAAHVAAGTYARMYGRHLRRMYGRHLRPHVRQAPSPHVSRLQTPAARSSSDGGPRPAD